MKRFAMALALMCALSTSIFAGDMPTGGKSEPPPPPSTSASTATATATANTLLNVLLPLITLR